MKNSQKDKLKTYSLKDLLDIESPSSIFNSKKMINLRKKFEKEILYGTSNKKYRGLNDILYKKINKQLKEGG